MSNKEKKPVNEKVKTAWIQCISAVLCVAIVLVGAMNITNKATDNKVAVAETVNGEGASDDNASEGGSAETGDVETQDATPADEGAVTGDETQKDEPVVPDDSGTVVDDNGGETVTPDVTTAANNGGSTTPTKAQPVVTTKAGGTTQAKAKTTAEIINIYNAATKKVVANKVAFSKSRSTKEKDYTAGVALRSFKSIVYKFMGVGDSNKFTKTVTKEDADSYQKYFQASRLTAADVTGATIKESGGNTTITLTLKNGSSTVTGGKTVGSVNNTALDKCGIAQGMDDKDYWDHKNAQNLFAAIDEVPGCGSANISEKYSGATVTVVINAKGNITGMTVKFDLHIDLAKVMGSSGSADASTTVTMNQFKW